MATMPNLIGFSLDYSIQQLSALGIVPAIVYTSATAPVTVNTVSAQSPASGATITGLVVLTLPGPITYPGIGSKVFSQPAILVGNDDPP